MARRPAKSPRLGKLAAADTAPARMARAARDTVDGWRATEDSDRVRRFTDELRADVATGLAAAEEQADDVDTSEAGAAKHVAAVVAAMRAMLEALTEELARM